MLRINIDAPRRAIEPLSLVLPLRIDIDVLASGLELFDLVIGANEETLKEKRRAEPVAVKLGNVHTLLHRGGRNLFDRFRHGN